MFRRWMSLILLVSLLALPVQAHAIVFTGKTASQVVSHVHRVKSAFQKAAVSTVSDYQSHAVGVGAAAINKLAEPSTSAKGLGRGFVYGFNAAFLGNLYKEVKKEYGW